LLLMCIMIIVCINFELKRTEYKIYIKTLDKFCVDFTKNRGMVGDEEKN